MSLATELERPKGGRKDPVDLVLLNLGCGTKTSERAVNIDWSIHVRIARNPLAMAVASRILSRKRVQALQSIRGTVQLHDLTKGLPYADGSVDGVYHSHVLEHIARDFDHPEHDRAMLFVAECRRVLKAGGVLRIVVPNLEYEVRAYLDNLQRIAAGTSDAASQDSKIYKFLGQATRVEASGTSEQAPLMRKLENLLLGDARKRGETHMWEYDRFNLTDLLNRAGFTDVRVVDYRTSAIPGWNDIGLDLDLDGQEYKPTSLYVEGVK